MIFTENIVYVLIVSIYCAGTELYKNPVGGGERVRTLPRDLYNNPDALCGSRYVHCTAGVNILQKVIGRLNGCLEKNEGRGKMKNKEKKTRLVLCLLVEKLFPKVGKGGHARNAQYIVWP